MRSAGSAADASPRYRWTVLAVTTIILAVTMGQIVNGLSVYFVPMSESEGWGRGDIALINSSGLLGLALGSLVMGFASERFGVRPVVLMGIATVGAMTMLASWATDLWQFYVLYFIAGALGGSAISAPLMALVGNWFAAGAGLAIGIASAGQALGQGGVPFTGALLIEAMGWRGAMMTQGIVTLLVLLPVGLLLRDPPVVKGAAAASEETPSGLPNTVIMLWIALATVFCCTCMAVPLMHLVPLIQGRGFSAPEASGVLFVMLLTAIVGRVAFGKLTDIIGALPAYLTASAWQTVMVFGFYFIDRIGVFYAYAVVYGFGYAGVMTTIIVTTRNLTAPARRASSLGVVMAFAYAGHGLGGWQGGVFFDQTGAYQWTFANAAIAGVINLAIVSALWLTIHRRPSPALA
ncbi:MFS transporter [Roseisalinus antarcticus]|uniref:Putative MFS-type transporter YhjX n=1 Tax=Roseisalinus antarcticus TaxID=254357 RepID=A0A1Y5SQU7_9RHOB|nr:MFS transporter [Roseisalinus antarcticus]SLN43228.1 putative MFS-type transporter YhjX [Roseisalinus antarcticus]